MIRIAGENVAGFFWQSFGGGQNRDLRTESGCRPAVSMKDDHSMLLVWRFDFSNQFVAAAAGQIEAPCALSSEYYEDDEYRNDLLSFLAHWMTMKSNAPVQRVGASSLGEC